MKKIKSFSLFTEDLDVVSDKEQTLETENKETQEKYQDIKTDISEMIENSLKTADKKTIEDFITAYIKNPEDTLIEGFINDADVYDFYLKYRNDIDEILSDINFYDTPPSEYNSYSLYDYVVEGTKEAVLKLIKDLVNANI